jgi:predicted  nucleic acid-binding Zn-ribbon protein
MGDSGEFLEPLEEPSLANDATPQLLEPLYKHLIQQDETERYRVLSRLLAQMESWTKAGGDQRKTELAAQAEGWAKRNQTLQEENAGLKDALAQAQSDLERHTAQLKAEQTHAQGLDKIVAEQRMRLEALTKHVGGLETDLTARNAEIHQVRVAGEDLTLRLQRAVQAAGDMSKIDRLEAVRRELEARLKAREEEIGQFRAEKDAEIEKLRARLLALSQETGQGADAALAKLWLRLATAKPCLAEGHVKPTMPATERFFDAFIELAGFAHAFEQDVRPFLDDYTKHNELAKKPWEAYRAYGQIHDTIRDTIAVQGGKPVGVLKMRLRGLMQWTIAALLASDRAIDCVGEELQQHLLGSANAGGDPNCRVRDYLKNSGHDKFRQHIRDLRNTALAKTYGLGA